MNQINHSAQILADYRTLEPGKSDTWNPLRNEYELGYRLSLFYALVQALGLSQIPIESTKVLDLGCGNGRSTRMYIDLGFQPEQLTGLDLRVGAIDLANKLNPAIQYGTYDGNEIPFPDRSFNWIQLTTVVSSIQNYDTRRHLAEQIYQKLEPGGYLFYYDLCCANDFAGGDRILPVELFSAFEQVWYSPLRRLDFIPNSKIRQSFFQEIMAGEKKYIYRKLRSRISLLIRPYYEVEVLLAQKI